MNEWYRISVEHWQSDGRYHRVRRSGDSCGEDGRADGRDGEEKWRPNVELRDLGWGSMIHVWWADELRPDSDLYYASRARYLAGVHDDPSSFQQKDTNGNVDEKGESVENARKL